MTRVGYSLYLRQGARNYEDSDESDRSQQSEDSQNSQETNSSQERRALINLRSRILDEVEQRQEAQLNALSTKGTEIQKMWPAWKPRTFSFLFTEKS